VPDDLSHVDWQARIAGLEMGGPPPPWYKTDPIALSPHEQTCHMRERYARWPYDCEGCWESRRLRKKHAPAGTDCSFGTPRCTGFALMDSQACRLCVEKSKRPCPRGHLVCEGPDGVRVQCGPCAYVRPKPMAIPGEPAGPAAAQPTAIVVRLPPPWWRDLLPTPRALWRHLVSFFSR
jgi:hypothetical protein